MGELVSPLVVAGHLVSAPCHSQMNQRLQSKASTKIHTHLTIIRELTLIVPFPKSFNITHPPFQGKSSGRFGLTTGESHEHLLRLLDSFSEAMPLGVPAPHQAIQCLRGI